MPIQLVRNDITRMHVDAIVNAANRHLSVGGGVSAAIHRAAGPALQADCRAIGTCPVGEARITPGHLLPCRYVIHTVGPIWQGGTQGEEDALAACYTHALALAVAHDCRSIAFPMLATGAHGYPAHQALKIATDTIRDFLLRRVPDNDLMVYLVTFTKESLSAGTELFEEVRQYIDDRYVAEHLMRRPRRTRRAPEMEEPLEAACPVRMLPEAWYPDTLEGALSMIDESFSEMILRKIQEKGMKNADCYKKANIDKKLFSKIIHQPHYKPRKTTALALAVALELSLDETKELLMKAGLALSHSEKFDIIVEYFIQHGRYDIFEINEILYDYDQALLGGAML